MAARERLINWYHMILVHPGIDKQLNTMRSVFTWPKMKKDIEHHIKHCHICQMSKRTNKKKYGLLPEKLAETTKWRRVNVDLWGPKTIKNVNGYDYQVHVMTMVDPVTGWPEFAQLYGKPTAYRCQEILDNVWLSRYPRPEEIGFDNGGEFQGQFSDLCTNMSLTRKPSSSWNPQSNAILERIHQVLAEGLRAFDLDNKEIAEDNDDPFEEYLSAVAYAIRAAYHQTHGHSPAQLVFGRDMFLPVKRKIDWEDIRKRKQERIRKSNARENSNRIDHDFKKGDWVTLTKPGQITRKLALPREGPYKVV